MSWQDMPCLLHSGSTAKVSGYGQVNQLRFGRRINYAHVLAWIDAHGTLPPAVTPIICHHCDNPPCVEPTHLYAGTHASNAADKVARGRQHHGESHPMHRLSSRAVLGIKAQYATGRWTQRALGENFGVSGSQIGLIVRGQQRRLG